MGDEAGEASLEMRADGSFAMDTEKGQHINGTWKLDGGIRLQFGPSTMVLLRR